MNAPLLRNPRVVVPPSRRIPNWRTLPVEGAGKRPIGHRLLEWTCNAAIVGLGLLIACFCARYGWNW